MVPTPGGPFPGKPITSGKVSVALDRELNRKVAFKEILDKIADHPPIRARFVVIDRFHGPNAPTGPGERHRRLPGLLRRATTVSPWRKSNTMTA